VDDAAVVRGFERFGDLAGDGQGIVEFETAQLQALGESGSFDEFHDERGRRAGKNEGARTAVGVGMDHGRLVVGERAILQAVDRGDVGMIQGSEKLGLTAEAGHAFDVGGEGSGKNFERDFAAEFGIAGAVDFAHAADAERADDFVRAELGAGG